MNTEDAWKAARHLNEAAEVARRAADSLSESTHRLTHMFEPGYAGLAEQLVQLLQLRTDIEVLIQQRDELLRIARRIAEVDTRLGLELAVDLATVISKVESQL